MTKEDMILQKIESIEKNQQNVWDTVDLIKIKLFEGNGQKSLSNQISDNALKLKIMCWCIGVLYTGAVTGIVTLIIKKFGG